jgi:hypothetical protein
MIDISEELKTLYKTDYMPYRAQPIDKQLDIYFPEIDIHIYNDKIVADSFSIEESICSETDITFGSCEAGTIKFTVVDISSDLKGKVFTVTQKVDGSHVLGLGSYIVDSVVKQSNKQYKEITAYDSMIRFDRDVTAWYKGLSFPMSLKQFRISLCNHIGIESEEQTLCNDNMIVERTIDPQGLIGREVLKRIAEINGSFGHINRQNRVKFISLGGLGVFPSENLFPTEELYPSESTEYLGNAGYRTIDYEEYIVQPITKLQIRQETADIGCIVGTGDNTYIIEDNFLVYGKGDAELQVIANNVFKQIKNKYYRPHNTALATGLPYIEVGDAISIVTNTDTIESFVFKRTLSGIQALKDEISATGNEYRANEVGLRTEVIQLKGKMLKIQKTVDELSVEMNDLEKNVDSKYTQTAELIQAEVNRAKGSEQELSGQITLTAERFATQLNDASSGLQSQINQSAGKIELKVDKGGIIAAINLSSETASIDASKINLNGYVTVTDLSTGGSTIINGSNVRTGTIDASVVNIKNLNASNITTGTLKAITLQNNGITLNNNDIILNNGSGSIKDSSGKTIIYAGSSAIEMGSGVASLRMYASEYKWEGSTLSFSSSSGGTIGLTCFGYGSMSLTSSKSLLYHASRVEITSAVTAIRGDSSLTLTGSSIKLDGSSLDLNASYIGFFGHTPSSRKTVSIASGSDITSVRTALNNLINALVNYGLITS